MWVVATVPEGRVDALQNVAKLGLFNEELVGGLLNVRGGKGSGREEGSVCGREGGKGRDGWGGGREGGGGRRTAGGKRGEGGGQWEGEGEGGGMFNEELVGGLLGVSRGRVREGGGQWELRDRAGERSKGGRWGRW